MGVQRFDRDGRPINPAGPFGGGRQEPVETPEQKRERFSHAPDEPTPHEGLEDFNLAWEEVTGELGAVEHTPQPVDAAIMQAADAASCRVVAASLSSAERDAKAFVDEMERRGVTFGDRHFHSDDDEPATDYETERLVAELEQSGDDEEVGVDGAGNTVYRPADGGEDYVLVDGE